MTCPVGRILYIYIWRLLADSRVCQCHQTRRFLFIEIRRFQSANLVNNASDQIQYSEAARHRHYQRTAQCYQIRPESDPGPNARRNRGPSGMAIIS